MCWCHEKATNRININHANASRRRKPDLIASVILFASIMSSALSFRAMIQRSPRHRLWHVCAPRPQPNNYLETLSRSDSFLASSWVPFITPRTMKTKAWERLFDVQLPEGRCIGLRLSDAVDPCQELTPEGVAHTEHWIHNMLHPQEVSFGVAQPSQHARTSFFLGRLAMREALRLHQHTANGMSILKDEHGRPTVPNGFLGSISHKGTTGVALVATTQDERTITGIGIDIEQTFSGRRSIAPRVLTEREQRELGRIGGLTAEEEVLLRFRYAKKCMKSISTIHFPSFYSSHLLSYHLLMFSIKESLYKAMHPLICQYVGFQEAEVTPHANGTASVVWNLKSGAHARFGVVTAHWRRLLEGEFFLTSASVTLTE